MACLRIKYVAIDPYYSTQEQSFIGTDIEECWSQKSFLIQGYLDAMMEMRKSEITEKKKEYPKTLKECRRMLDIDSGCLLASYDIGLWKGELLDSLQKLLICRDAYWKIAGEEMGLGKPWKPDCNSGNFIPAIIYRSGSIQKVEVQYRNAIFSFPTTEMRNAFKENFDPDIEICKEFL